MSENSMVEFPQIDWNQAVAKQATLLVQMALEEDFAEGVYVTLKRVSAENGKWKKNLELRWPHRASHVNTGLMAAVK